MPKNRVILTKKMEVPVNIHEIIKKLVATERDSTHQILKKLNELHEGRLYAELGYSSLFEYCTRELKYSSDQACRRIAAAKLLRTLPIMSKSVEAGDLTVTHLSKAQTLFNKVELSQNEKVDILKRMENTSNFEAEKIICEINPKKTMNEKVRPVEKNVNELKVFIDDELLLKLKQIKDQTNHENLNETILFLCNDYLKKQEKVKTTVDKEAVGKNSRYIPTAVKQKIKIRSNQRCEFVSKNGVRCSSCFKLEYAHIVPYSRGGLNTANNLMLLCKAHNQLDALIIFGSEKMGPYLNGNYPE